MTQDTIIVILVALGLEAPVLIPLYFYLVRVGKRALARHRTTSHTDLTHPSRRNP